MKERVELFFHALVQYEITVELNKFLEGISSFPPSRPHLTSTTSRLVLVTGMFSPFSFRSSRMREPVASVIPT